MCLKEVFLPKITEVIKFNKFIVNSVNILVKCNVIFTILEGKIEDYQKKTYY